MSLKSALIERWAWLLLSLVVLIVDQVSKALAHGLLRQREPVEIIPGLFSLIYSRNPGGLFGYFRELPDFWRVVLLTIFPVAAVVLIVTYLLRADVTDRPTRAGLSLILGGALGNLIDRLFRGEVIDFLDAYLGTAHWPTFNLADSAIVCGAGLLLVSILRPARAQARADEPGTG